MANPIHYSLWRKVTGFRRNFIYLSLGQLEYLVSLCEMNVSLVLVKLSKKCGRFPPPIGRNLNETLPCTIGCLTLAFWIYFCSWLGISCRSNFFCASTYTPIVPSWVLKLCDMLSEWTHKREIDDFRNFSLHGHTSYPSPVLSASKTRKLPQIKNIGTLDRWDHAFRLKSSNVRLLPSGRATRRRTSADFEKI